VDFIVYFLITDQSWDSELYGTITAIQKFTPVLLNPLWVALAEVVGIKAVIIFALLCAADGILIMTLTSWKLLFCWAACLVAFQAIRPLRMSYVLMATHKDIRTTCTAYLNFATDSMRMLGALTSKFWDHVLPLKDYTHSVRHRVTNLTSFVICLINVLVMALFFQNEAGEGSLRKRTASTRAVKWTKYVQVREHDGRTYTINGDRHAMMLTAMTGTFFFSHSLATAIYFVANMPVLCTVFNLDEEYVQNIKLVQELVAIPAPLLIVWCKNLTDRSLLIIGFIMSAVGMLLFGMPLLHSSLQPCFGMIFIRASQPFFYAPACSGFSKMMGVRSSGYSLALLTSLSAFGTTIGSWFGADFAIKHYGTWWFFLSLVPSALALVIVLSPCFFRRMDLEDPVTSACIHQWEEDEEQSRFEES